MYHTVPGEELRKRVGSFQESLKEKGLDAAVIAQPVDLYYLAGTIQQAFFYIPQDDEPFLAVRRSLPRAREETPWTAVAAGGTRDLPGLIRERGLPLPRRVGLELDVLPVAVYRRLEKAFAGAALEDCSPLLRGLRAVKSGYEIEAIKRAAAVVDAAFRRAAAVLRPGMTELELAAEAERAARLAGHHGAVRMRAFNLEVFFGHVISGEDAALGSFFEGPTGGRGPGAHYPQGAGHRKIEAEDAVIVDMVGAWGGYLADQTRVLSAGRPDPRLARAHRIALKIEEAVAAAARPGVLPSDLYQLALVMAEEEGLGDNFMGGGGERVGFIGHGVGVELDEWPVIGAGQKTPLEEGMVFALEPKFLFPGLGAVGIEDTFVVTSRGAEPLTFSPREITVAGGGPG